MQPMNQELLNYLDYNIINVDWGGFLASKTLYTQATANTRVVAAEIVYLLKTLMVGYIIIAVTSKRLVLKFE